MDGFSVSSTFPGAAQGGVVGSWGPEMPGLPPGLADLDPAFFDAGRPVPWRLPEGFVEPPGPPEGPPPLGFGLGVAMLPPPPEGMQPPGPPPGLPPGRFTALAIEPGLPSFPGGLLAAPRGGWPPGFNPSLEAPGTVVAGPMGPPQLSDASRCASEQAAELALLLSDSGGGLSFGGFEGSFGGFEAPPLDFSLDLSLAAFQPEVFRVKAPPPAGPPPGSSAYAPTTDAGEAAAKKRRRSGVEGLASSKHIKSGGAVTVYAGYSSVTSASAGQVPKASGPAPTPANALQRQQALPGVGVPGMEALPRQLPEGWEMKRSRTSGRIYYLNEKLGTSQFEPPAGSTVKAEVKKKHKTSTKKKDIPDAQVTDKNGLIGLVRASDGNTRRWAKWNKCNQNINADDPQ